MKTRHILSLCIVALLVSLMACVDKQTPAPASNSNAPSPPKPSGPAAYAGFHDIASCDEIVGWCWDQKRPDEPINVDIFDGSNLIGSVTADTFRQDLLDDHKGNGKHGFVFPTPPSLKDGKPHTIRVKFAGTALDLGNTPKDINCKFEQK